MSKAWLSPDDLVRQLDDRLVVLQDAAFPHGGYPHYYSGPSADVARALIGNHKSNRDRAVIWARKHGTTLIDDTPLGRDLNNFEGVGTFRYFNNNPLIAIDQKINAALLPWKHLSRHFALSVWGHVSTTVCGANRGAVYYTLELPYTLNHAHFGLRADDFIHALLNPRRIPIETINLVPFAQIFAGYNGTGYERAHDLICMGEQRVALHEALKSVKPASIKHALALASKEVLSSPVEAYEYFLESRDRYQLDRKSILQDLGKPVPASYGKTPQERYEKRTAQLEAFGMAAFALVKTELDLMPKTMRPNLAIPDCLMGRVAL